jgi:hypothetical protein
MCISLRWCQSNFIVIYFFKVNSAFNGSVHSIKQNADQWITSKKGCGRSGLGLIWGTSLAFCSKGGEMPWKLSHHSLSTGWIFNMSFKKWCHSGADCLNVLFSDVTRVLTVWMCCLMMSLGCWLFECAVQWCHLDADCLNVTFSDATRVLTVWMCCSVMSLGCWLFECSIHWWHWGADCLNVMLKDVTAGSDNHILLGVMTVHVTHFFLKLPHKYPLLCDVCLCDHL